jgi:uncharacterized protein (DUF433 family)
VRITVYDVLEYLASGTTPQEILTDFPHLTEDDIRACLSFVAARERFIAAVQPRPCDRSATIPLPAS